MRSPTVLEIPKVQAQPLPQNENNAETALIERCKIGDQHAFALLIKMHQDKVYTLAYRILRSYEDADDATQEIFVKIWQALPNFRGQSKFSTWIYRIVHNHCLNKLRSNKSEPRTVSVQFPDDDDIEEQDLLANLPGDTHDDPAWQFDNLEKQKAVWGQVDNLPAKYRAIIALYYSDELSYEEIAEVMNQPVGTVKTHLFRAKALLKSRLLELKNNGMLN
jgi:RNA polymerase sigma-70 factor, ECF subfamily